MAYVKLDTGILDSSLWFERPIREVFITALLMAEPYELMQPAEQIAVRTLKPTGFIVPAGWYGLVRAAGIGIIGRALVEHEEGLAALESLGAADPQSRSKAFGGRRLVRVDHGYLVLNFIAYREKDHTTAERSRRYRQKKQLEAGGRAQAKAAPRGRRQDERLRNRSREGMYIPPK